MIDSPQRKTCLIYSMGGGLGHFNRALALGRIAADYYNVIILTNSACYNFVNKNLSVVNCEFIHISPNISFENTCILIQQFILNTCFDCIVVDTFPRGLGGELSQILASLSVPKILVHRDINPEYIQSKNLTRFVESVFDLILIPGEVINSPFAHLHRVEYTSSWLIRGDHELPTLDRAFSILKIPPEHRNTKLIVILASGQIEDLVYYERLARSILQEVNNVTLRFLSPFPPASFLHSIWVSHYPAIECLAAADLVIGGGGYNTVHECQALEVPLLAIPFPRLYDRQASRIHHLITSDEASSQKISLAASSENILNRINSSLPPRLKGKVSFTNGVTEAVAKIKGLLL